MHLGISKWPAEMAGCRRCATASTLDYIYIRSQIMHAHMAPLMQHVKICGFLLKTPKNHFWSMVHSAH